MTTRALPDIAASIGDELPPDQVERLAATIETYATPDPATGVAIRRLVPNDRYRILATELFTAWEAGTTDGPAIALALRTAAISHDNHIGNPRVDIVWTGPSSFRVPVRHTRQVLKEVIDSAHSDLYLLSFAAYKVPEIVAALNRAVGRGVTLRMILETEVDSGGKLKHDAADAFTDLNKDARLYTWPAANRPTGAAMHAKAAIADATIALVTSANITGSAIRRNMELGIKITGGDVPHRLADHLSHLIESETLTPVAWA